MTCQETRQLLDRYLAGQAGRRDTQLVADHLEACAACWQIVMALVGVVGRREGIGEEPEQ